MEQNGENKFGEENSKKYVGLFRREHRGIKMVSNLFFLALLHTTVVYTKLL